MGLPAKNEVDIVEVLAQIHLPEHIVHASRIRDLLSDIIMANAAVSDGAARLDQIRQEKKDGDFIGNWWNEREERIQEAQLDLNGAIGRLTQKTSQLLVVNTAISKYLTGQQRMLLQQQAQLQSQADAIADQNAAILEQQKRLEQQQREINIANQGLLEAKGISQQQAQALVGCVKRVVEAESRIEAAGDALQAAVEARLEEAAVDWADRLKEGFRQLDARHADLRRELDDALAQRLLDDVRAELTAAQAAFTTQLGLLAAEQAKAVRRGRVTFMAIAAAAIASLAGQIIEYFALR